MSLYSTYKWHTAQQSPLKGKVHQRKSEDDMKDGIEMSRHFMLYVMHFIYSLLFICLELY
jgi:hypothetical protein